MKTKQELYKTAQTLTACADFREGEFVSVKFYFTDEKGIDWYLIGSHGRIAYPAHHLTRFTF